MPDIPEYLRFAESREWARLEADGTVTVGISNHAQEALGEVVFVELTEVGKVLAAGPPVRENDDALPTPAPGDTARLDQIAACWRDADPEAKEAVGDAAAALQASPSLDSVTGLLDALEQAGMYYPSKD
ncbi:hypothetical protein KZO11_34070 [Streptomyces anulatus]|uniref:hypothetical protein n=1 Tax=Streptomyces anulatus TaxID=1892 RepID=UPI001C5EEC9A|nr:hypothetical protein [Streptomyces anulatus]QYA98267.1 hypothetical protein KZO11_34070 [Streptomyces anulatus]